MNDREAHLLLATLMDIADERGKCAVCGRVAEGEGSGYVACEDKPGRCTWAQRDPVEVAKAVLEAIKPKE